MYLWMTSSGLEAEGGTQEGRVKETDSAGDRRGWIKTTSPAPSNGSERHRRVGETQTNQKGLMRDAADGVGWGEVEVKGFPFM